MKEFVADDGRRKAAKNHVGDASILLGAKTVTDEWSYMGQRGSKGVREHEREDRYTDRRTEGW